MFCEYAYYPNNDENQKLNCNNPKKIEDDEVFKEKCPLIYYCKISERYENTIDMFNCIYRDKNDG